MKVLLYMPTPGGLTGAPRRLLTLAQALRQHGVHVCVASESDSELLSAARALGLDTEAIDTYGILSLRQRALLSGAPLFKLRAAIALLRQNWRFFRCVGRQRADVVWTRGGKGIAFAGLGALLSRRPLLWDVDYELPSRGLVHWLHRFGLWLSRAVVFQYSSAGDEIFGKDIADRYRWKFQALIPGIDISKLEKYRQTRRCASPLRAKEPFIVLQVGTICERKNQRLLIEALQEVELRTLPVQVYVKFVGGVFEQTYADELRQMAARAGLSSVIDFLGWRDDVHELMTNADVLVMPSRDEGVPNAVQEAMYIGLPVIVSKAGGMPEVVEHGETGWVLPIADVRAWADRIRSCVVAPDRCSRVGLAASDKAATYFGPAVWGRRYADVVRSLAQQKRQGV